MKFYEVIPGDRNYHGHEALTYTAVQVLHVGQIVVVKLRTKSVMGFVVRSVEKPDFEAKPIDSVIEGAVIPSPHVVLFEWMSAYYPGPLGSIASLFIPPALSVKKLKTPNISSVQTIISDSVDLTKDQQNTLVRIPGHRPGTFFLHGDTGTGKTQVYIELAKQTLAQNKSVLILTPEIGLTPQLIATLGKHFKNIHLNHSEMTDTKRRETWRSLAIASSPQLLVGPRSSLFMPLRDIGLIVMDEFHDGAYKQEQSPRYRAIRVAAQLSKLHGAQLVLGSATPPIDEYYYAEAKHVPILRMTEKPTKAEEAPVTTTVVDLANKDERTKYPLITTTLLTHIRTTLENREQVLLFLNKRGHARLLLCQACGWHAECERCNLPFTYHADNHSLRCHTCGARASAPNSCPECRSSDIIFRSPGTKAIAESIAKLFPDSRIARFDKDNTKEESFSSNHEDIASGAIDILIGTQLLAKGHDLPNLSLVGILHADNGLQFPDFASEERSYQLLHQLAGRVGRGHRAGTVVVQTYNPESPSIKAVDHGNAWLEFYTSQLESRKLFGFPPFSFILKVEVQRAKSTAAEAACISIAEDIRQHFPRVQVVGPSPSFIAKKGGKWNWQLIVKSTSRARLVEIAKSLPARTSFDLDPISLL